MKKKCQKKSQEKRKTKCKIKHKTKHKTKCKSLSSMKKKTCISLLIVISIISCTTLGYNWFKKKKKTYYPANIKKSVVLKVVSPKKEYITKEIIVRNTLKDYIYVTVDCNYRTDQYGGGYERRSTPNAIRPGSASTMFAYYPKNQKIAVRWTLDKPDEKAEQVTWYETLYFNFAKKKVVVIDIKRMTISEGRKSKSIIAYVLPGTKAITLTPNKLVFTKEQKILSKENTPARED